MTEASFAKWKEAKLARKAADVESKRVEEAKKSGTKGYSALSGRALFSFDPALFVDDAGADDTLEFDDEEEEEEGEAAEGGGAGAGDKEGGGLSVRELGAELGGEGDGDDEDGDEDDDEDDDEEEEGGDGEAAGEAEGAAAAAGGAGGHKAAAER